MRVILEQDDDFIYLEILIDTYDLLDIKDGIGATREYCSDVHLKKDLNVFLRKMTHKEELEYEGNN